MSGRSERNRSTASVPVAVAVRDGLAWSLGAAVLTGLLMLVARDVTLGAWVTGGFVAAFGVFAGVGWIVLRGVGRIRAGAGSGWRYGLANLERHALGSVVQIAGLIARRIVKFTSELVHSYRIYFIHLRADV